jgi:hypothetical protein
MNQRIIKLGLESGMLNYVEHETPRHYFLCANADEECLAKFAELIVKECIGILETEIELVKGYKSTACNDFDVRWHQGKIEHFAKLVEKSKKHFGVEG